MTFARLVTIGVAALLFTAPVLCAADLASAKALYAAASYEEALAMLTKIEAPENLEQVNQIRALCLLALGRTDDAQQAIQAIVLHDPFYQLEPNEVSPKLVALFHEVRRQVFPTLVRNTYTKAKSQYDAKEWRQASVQFTALVRMLNDKDAAGQQETFADLRQLGEGFLALANSELAAEKRRDEEARRAEEERRAAEAAAEAARRKAGASQDGTPASAVTATAEDAGAGRAAAPVYTAEDRDVIPPAEISRALPRWVPPSAAMASATHSGRLELLIDEAGGVVSVTIVKSVSPSYDGALRDMARTWRYRPATRNGRPVRYRQLLEIVLRPAK